MARQRERHLQVREPLRLDVEREDHRPLRRRRLVQVGVRFPRVDEDHAVVGQRRTLAPHDERAVLAAGLDEDVAMRMRMRDERRVHVEEGDTRVFVRLYPQRRRDDTGTSRIVSCGREERPPGAYGDGLNFWTRRPSPVSAT